MACGELIGLAVAGFLADRFGWRSILTGMMAMLTGCLFIFAFAKNLGMMVAAMVLCGEYRPKRMQLARMYADGQRYSLGCFSDRVHCLLL